MPARPVTGPAASPAEPARRARNRRLAIATGTLVLLAVVVATGVWVTAGRSSTPDPVAAGQPQVRAGEHSLLVGGADAPVTVVVYEDFLCPDCRQLDTSTRDFLRQDAARGTVRVEYRPFQMLPDDYSGRALGAWAQVLEHGTPAQALRFHDLLYDEQPREQDASKPGVAALQALARSAGVSDPTVLDTFGSPDAAYVAAARRSAARAGVRDAPTVLVDGKPLEAGTIQDLADRLEKLAAQSPA